MSGENRTETIAKEYGLRFFVDISKVYYNPRLSEEHRKVSEFTSDGELVLDMFSGVGGFSIHIAARRNALVFANDINSFAIYCLSRSILLNKKKIKGGIYAIVHDAKSLPDFLSQSIKFNRIIMNNPTMYESFLELAEKLSSDKAVLHLYALLNRNEVNISIDRILKKLPSFHLIQIEEVIEYSPASSIYRLDLRHE